MHIVAFSLDLKCISTENVNEQIYVYYVVINFVRYIANYIN